MLDGDPDVEIPASIFNDAGVHTARSVKSHLILWLHFLISAKLSCFWHVFGQP